MELWVAAATAGAGYLVKYLHRLSRNSDSSSQLSSEGSRLENPESPSSPFRGQAWRDKLGRDVPAYRRTTDGKPSDASSLDVLLTTEKASNSDSEKRRHFRSNDKGNVRISNLTHTFSPNENLEDSDEGIDQRSNVVDKYGSVFPDSSAGEVSSTHHFRGNKTSLKTRHSYRHFIRPLNSLESCLMAQLYTEHAKMEEYVFSSVSSPSTLLISDGSQIVSKTDDDSLSASVGRREYKLHKKDYREKEEDVSGVPSLPKIGPLDYPKKKLKARKGQSGRLSSSNNVFGRKYVHTQHDVTFIFSLGISLGILISIMTNKKEMDKLRELLKQTDNLVQDLQEELEMKDSLTVKELNNENYGSQHTCDLSFYDKELNGFSPEKHMDNSPRNGCKELYDEKAEESSDSISKIEAELEAELERLGLNMNTSTLDRRISDPVELDPDFLQDFAQGELRVDRVREKASTHPKSNEDVGDTPTTLPGNYAVSPRELSLHLHEVIQSRLQQRVEELEIALQNSQRKVKLLESKHEGFYRGDCSSCEQALYFTRGTPVTNKDCDPMAQPLVMNLSGEALDAYNEAYEELINIDESEDDSPTGSHDNDQKEDLHHYNWHVSGKEHCGENGSAEKCSTTCSALNEARMSRENSSSKVTVLEGESSSVCELNGVTGDENYDWDNEMERQLIKQIVERTKKGSPVFQNAQRILSSMDEDGH
ncbi:hypothetical protein L6164_014504 [Bauhinia variegata]|uniref:Uncharacterized protein n=1 Tax=Bauhinia variegata TaxID=167791 RepID=A0ACB9NHC4_BAUVA|nr:hypothetical protein L6164_014504 [Bauhinia variegata]